MRVVKTAAAPGLTEPKPGKSSKRTVRQGEVLRALGTAGSIQWQGEVEGQLEKRDGEILEVKRAESDGLTFVFASDLSEAEVPAAGWVCEKLGNPVQMQMPCPQGLRRTMLSSGRMLAFVPGVEQVCPVALLSGAQVTVEEVIGLSDVRVMTMNGQQVVVAWSRWVRSMEWTGSDLVVMLTEPTLRRIGKVALEEADARKADEVTNLMGTLHLDADGARFDGKRRVFERATGKEKSSLDVVEHWRVTQDGRWEEARR